ncbi:septum site-determining protein Ssd [Acidipropionibacterium jensenii]|uniref:septum site-determining protein Ssd n=1 Tax=Acidipropionibacterium jensenii TaxID=1749 RepID=UPI00214C41B3
MNRSRTADQSPPRDDLPGAISAPMTSGRLQRAQTVPTIPLISADQRLTELVGAVAASIGVGVQVVTDRGGAQSVWADAGPLLIGQDRAAAVVAWQLPGRHAEIHLIGEDAADTARWSAVLGASVIVVPESTPTLVELLREGFRSSGNGVVLLVDQSSGGLGASTLAAGIARAAAVEGMRAALVELDPGGGGADLLLGLEQAPGWRWPELASARGAVSDLTGHLPALDGVAVVSVGRECLEVPSVARVSVVRSLTAEHDLVVLDAGRAPAASIAGLGIDARLELVGADLRSVMAARARRTSPDDTVVRQGPGRRMGLADIGALLGAEPAVVVPHDVRLPRAQTAGEAPWVMAGRRWRRSCRQLVTAVCHG